MIHNMKSFIRIFITYITALENYCFSYYLGFHYTLDQHA